MVWVRWQTARTVRNVNAERMVRWKIMERAREETDVWLLPTPEENKGESKKNRRKEKKKKRETGRNLLLFKSARVHDGQFEQKSSKLIIPDSDAVEAFTFV